MSAVARNGGERQALFSAIRNKVTDRGGAVIRPAEVVLILEWAVEAEDAACQAELLKIFGAAGGLDIVRSALIPDH